MKDLFERARPWHHALAVFLLVAVLIWPLFRLKYYAGWSSIESTFVSDGRMLQDNLPHRHWQPLWYCGTRADYIYPPALRYGTAVIAQAIGSTTARSYHLYCALLYAFGIAAVWAFVWSGTRSRGWSWLATAATALISPSFLIMPELMGDALWHEPQRLHVLMTYGEGPHMSALAWLPFVFAAAIAALRGGSWKWIAIAAVCAAGVVSNNFYGATALALLFPLVIWCWFLKAPAVRIWLQAAVIAALAWGLCAWWLTPSYLRVTQRNLRLVAEPGNLPSILLLVCVLALYAWATWRWRKALEPYRLFVFSGFGLMVLYVLGRRWFGFQVAGESTRLVPELDFVAILALVELLRMSSGKVPRWATAFGIAAMLLPGIPYLRNAWGPFEKDPHWESRIEYKITRWLHENAPASRAWVIGSVRLWYNTWFDLAQVDGGSQQGLQNLHLVPAQYRMVSDDIDLARLWLTALGADIAVVSERDSAEIYHDIANPERWHGQFEVLTQIERNTVYRIPRRRPGIVRLIDRAKVANIAPLPLDYETLPLQQYVAGIEADPPGGPDHGRIHLNRQHSDAMRITAEVRPGESILLQETFDPAWRAVGSSATIHEDAVGFMRIDVEPGKHELSIVFETPLEVHAGRAVTACTAGLIVFLLLRRRREQT